jgi:hypothetical protein
VGARPSPSNPKESTPRRSHAVAAAALVVVALVRTGPALLSGGEHVVGRDVVDTWVHLWAFWRTAYALGGHDEGYLVSHLLAWPGTYRELIALFDPLLPLLSVPLQWVFGLVTAANVLVTLGLAVSGLGGYLLVHRLTRSASLALLGGLVVMANPVLTRLLEQGFYEYAWWGLVPLALWLMLRLHPARGWRPRAAYAVALLALCTISIYCAATFVVVAAVALAWMLVWPRSRARAVHIVLGHGPAVALLSPLAVAWAFGLRAIGYRGMELQAGLHESIRVAAADPSMMPMEHGILLLRSVDIGELLSLGAASQPQSVVLVEWAALLALALAALAAGRSRRRHAVWAVAGLVCFALALGPALQADGRVLVDLTLPYAWCHDWLPGFSRLKFPGRFLIGTVLALAVLSPMGLGVLTRRLGSRRARAAVHVAVSVAVLGAFVAPRDLGPTLHHSAAEVPAFYLALGEAGEPHALLELPSRGDMPRRMYHQTAHRRPIYRGVVPDWYVQVHGEEVVAGNALVAQLQRTWPSPADIAPLGGEVDALVELGFGHLVLHRDGYVSDDVHAAAVEACSRLLGPPTERNEAFAAWPLSPRPR